MNDGYICIQLEDKEGRGGGGEEGRSRGAEERRRGGEEERRRGRGEGVGAKKNGGRKE